MDLVNFIGRRVKIQLSNGYYFIGQVQNADDNFIDIIDIRGKNVSLAKSSILTIQETGVVQ